MYIIYIYIFPTHGNFHGNSIEMEILGCPKLEKKKNGLFRMENPNLEMDKPWQFHGNFRYLENLNLDIEMDDFLGVALFFRKPWQFHGNFREKSNGNWKIYPNPKSSRKKSEGFDHPFAGDSEFATFHSIIGVH